MTILEPWKILRHSASDGNINKTRLLLSEQRKSGRISPTAKYFQFFEFSFFSLALNRTEQKSGPHMVQYSEPCWFGAELSFNACWRSVFAHSGSNAEAYCFSQSKAARASEMVSSCSRLPGLCSATSAAWAAILKATTPRRTSSALGRPRCSFGVT